MEEDLISFETAKLAKEKGFDIPQNKMFSTIIDRSIFNKTDNPEVIKFHNGDKHQCSNIPHDWNNTQSQTPTKYYSAPTQSLLQKWLREVHEIYVGSYHDLNPKHDGIIYYTNWGFINDPANKKLAYNPNGGYDENDNWKSYEEALEFGLQEALKLI